MPNRPGKLVFVAAACLAVTAAWSPPADAAGRDQMQECATRVLGRLAKAKAPEDQVGPAIVKECDRQLRAALSDAIKTGEAGGCTVESCLKLAQERAADESTEMYRQRASQ